MSGMPPAEAMTVAAGPLQRLQQAAQQVVELFAEAARHDAARRPREARQARERGGRLLHDSFSRWFERHFRRLGASDETAEDLTQDAFVKLYTQVHAQGARSNAFALLCAVRRSTYLDHLKHLHAAKRSADDAAQPAERLLSDEEWLELDETRGAEPPPADLVDCVQRKLHLYQAAAPSRAEVLELLCFGLSAREIAAVVYAKDEADVTAQEAANVRDRIYNARQQARALFAECKDD